MRSKYVFLMFFVLIFSIAANAVDSTKCLTLPENIILSVPKSGAVDAIVIYACGSDASQKLLPDWHDDICSTNDQYSTPNYFDDISFGNHLLTMTPFGKTDDSCFVANIAYATPPPVVTLAFFNDILAKADQVIDFGDYDNDGPDGYSNSGDDDGYVDFLFFAVVNHGGGRGVSTGYNF